MRLRLGRRGPAQWLAVSSHAASVVQAAHGSSRAFPGWAPHMDVHEPPLAAAGLTTSKAHLSATPLLSNVRKPRRQLGGAAAGQHLADARSRRCSLTLRTACHKEPPVPAPTLAGASTGSVGSTPVLIPQANLRPN